MAATSRKKLEDAKRADLLYQLVAKYQDEDVGIINSHTINIPVVYEDGTEGWANITVSLIRDLEHDEYQEREDYAMKLREKAEKAEKKKNK